MHRIFRDTEWEEEIFRNADTDVDIGTDLEDDGTDLTQKLAGCTFLKAVRKNGEYSAQIRIEERYRQQRFYVSAVVIDKKGRHTHDYELEDLIYYRTREFDFKEEGEHPENLTKVYEFVRSLKESIDHGFETGHFPKQ